MKRRQMHLWLAMRFTSDVVIALVRGGQKASKKSKKGQTWQKRRTNGEGSLFEREEETNGGKKGGWRERDTEREGERAEREREVEKLAGTEERVEQKRATKC